MNMKKIKLLVSQLAECVNEYEGEEMEADESDDESGDSMEAMKDDESDKEAGSFRVKSVAAMMKKKMMAGA